MLTPLSGQAFDSATIRAWHRTWHAPNPFTTPLRGYFIPRIPGRCDREAFADGWGYAAGVGYATPMVNQAGCTGAVPSWAYPPAAGMGFEPVQFERLGTIPNDFGLEGVQPAGVTDRPDR
jgi:hypothetical protein